ncbi:hypothetical protein U6A24_03960 [Aquimarina gracilis]|uniref:Thiol-activated cytolysin n=1 Tax=Aquimarina gracilis TaxID=874422 RepID=A0ABU5ZS30_9FLAO|nr:hypothetical protein [Aquimarina gracilis]MEB3344601.1 hypothetical protein [Aquimarina gracilis]
MSYTKSYLSDPHYGYDMVTAVTQTSVNATMMEWLSSYKGELFTRAYVYDPSTKLPVLTDYSALVKKLGFDPFTIPADTPDTDPKIKALIQEKFMFAFQIKIGLPNFPLDKIPPIVELNQQGSTVTYNMVCETFKIIDLQANMYGSSNWINLDQSTADAPWQIQFNVDLDLIKDSVTNKFHLLPKKIQDEIKNLGENLFSVQQLYFDLNTAALSSSFKVVGLNPTSQAFVYLSTVFLGSYVREVAKDGGIMLGFGVVSNTPFPKNVSLVPTDLNFVVSSYKDSSGKGTTDFDAYTLNYLIMANDNTMPPAVPFAWNWVEKNNLSKFAGSVAINRNVFADFLNNLISPSLGIITKEPTVSFHVNLIKANVTTGFKSTQGPYKYKLMPTGGSHVLSYSYTKEASDSDTFVPNWGNYSVKYTATSDIYLEGTQIKNVTKLNAHCHLNIDGGVTEGNWAQYTLTTHYNIGVNAQGQISVTMAQDPLKDTSEKPNPGAWAKFISLGTIDNMVSEIQGYLKNWLSGYINNESGTIQNMLNGSNTWVFPGSKTFTFQDAEFSDHQDMIAHVLYADPTGQGVQMIKTQQDPEPELEADFYQ